jgi:hypothetical protein
MKFDFKQNDEDFDLVDSEGTVNIPDSADNNILSDDNTQHSDSVEVDENGAVIHREDTSTSKKVPDVDPDVDNQQGKVFRLPNGQELDLSGMTPEQIDSLKENLSGALVDEATKDDAETGTDIDDPETDNDSKIFRSVIEVLKDKGVLKIFEDEENPDDILNTIKSEDDFNDLLEREAIARMDAKTKDIYEKMTGGVDVVKYNQLNNAITSLDNLVMDDVLADEDLTKSIIVQPYIEKGISPDVAENLYEVHKSKDEIKDIVLKNLVSKREELIAQRDNVVEEVNKAKESESNARNDKIKALKAKVESGEAFNRKLTKNMQDKMKRLIETPVDKDENGYPINELMKYQKENPVDFEYNLMYLYAITNGFKDVKAFERSAESSAAKKMRNVFENMHSFVDETKQQNRNNDNKYIIDPDSIEDIII